MVHDLIVIGGGVNGAGIARDAAGRGLKVVLVEAGDLAGGTSSASTKLVHGGIRYLEFGEVALVRKALKEREVILRSAPHIAWALPFLLPVLPGMRPAWMLRSGLFVYDHLARRREVPGASPVDLRAELAGAALKPELTQGFRFWDGWVDDARLVILLARDAKSRGARIITHDPVREAVRIDGLWHVETESGERLAGTQVVNAAGPWSERVARDILKVADPPALRLVQGAHLVTRRVNRTEDAFLLQQPDGRIVFVIPYERDFSLIGTTETPVDTPDDAHPTAEEEAYLLAAVNGVLKRPLTPEDVRYRFAGIRPLVLEAEKDARETTRDWRFVTHEGVAATSVVGGKITTFRLLAQALVDRLFPETKPWTARAVLPGGDVPALGGRTARANFLLWRQALVNRFSDHDPAIIVRLAGLYGTEAEAMLAGGLGERLPGGLFEAEVRHLETHEFARDRDDMLWRRTKLGLTPETPPPIGMAFAR
jgi:glycerol-3-phosphate dehydrogenase